MDRVIDDDSSNKYVIKHRIVDDRIRQYNKLIRVREGVVYEYKKEK